MPISTCIIIHSCCRRICLSCIGTRKRQSPASLQQSLTTYFLIFVGWSQSMRMDCSSANDYCINDRASTRLLWWWDCNHRRQTMWNGSDKRREMGSWPIVQCWGYLSVQWTSIYKAVTSIDNIEVIAVIPLPYDHLVGRDAPFKHGVHDPAKLRVIQRLEEQDSRHGLRQARSLLGALGVNHFLSVLGCLVSLRVVPGITKSGAHGIRTLNTDKWRSFLVPGMTTLNTDKRSSFFLNPEWRC